MNPDVLLVVGCLFISSALTYAWWAKARVWMLRQDMFDVRDQLWDRMLAKGLLDSEEHLKARHRINYLIRFAPMLSLPAIVASILIDREEGVMASFNPNDEDVRAAYFSVASAAMNYIMKETIAGRMIAILVKWVIRGDRVACMITSAVRAIIDKFLHDSPFEYGRGC